MDKRMGDLPVAMRLARFFDTCIEASWDGQDMDGGSIQDTAEHYGLIVGEPYDPEKHDAAEFAHDPQPGDQWFRVAADVSQLIRDFEKARDALDTAASGRTPNPSDNELAGSGVIK